MKKTIKKIIVVAGVSLDQKNFPVLYRWAKTNPDTLAERLENMAKSFHSNTQSVAQSFESDLEHSQ